MKIITCDPLNYNAGPSSLNCIGVAPITQVTHVRNKNSDFQGRSLNVIKVVFHTIEERNRSLWLQEKKENHCLIQ